MHTVKSLVVVVGLGLAFLVSSVAGATVIAGLPGGGTFVEVPPQTNPNGAGNYGVELRIGDSGGVATWEIGVGRGTSQPGNFNQANFAWVSNSTAHPFSLTWNASGVSITIDSVTVTDSGVSAPLIGDTLKIFAKRDATVVFTSVDGVALPSTLNGTNDAYFYSSDSWGGDGFTVIGTVRIGDTQGFNSNSEIQFKVGTTTIVPEPATIGLLALGLAGLGSARRRSAQR